MTCTALSPDLAAHADAWTGFAAQIAEVLTRLGALPPDELIPVYGLSGLHIGDVVVADFIAKLSNISWTLVDASFAGLNGGVGQVLSTFRNANWLNPADWQSAAEQIDATAFTKYLALEGGAYYLILHETAHTTALGLQTNNQQFDHYLANHGDRNDGAAWARSPQWNYNEQVANAIAKAVGDRIDIEILDHPTCGFPDGLGPPLRTVTAA